MAHAQPSHESLEAYCEKNKGAVNDIVKMASNLVAKHCQQSIHKDKQKVAVTIGVRIQNNAKGDSIKLYDKHDWSGQRIAACPDGVPRGLTGDFAHFDHTGCDQAALVYADGGGLGWLLAWSVGGHAAFGINPNKVYVEVGPIHKYSKIEWDVIKSKLDASRDISSHTDETAGCMAFATVSPGKRAALMATFNAMSLF